MRSLWNRWREKRRQKAAMSRFGWDAKCSGCGRWMHAESCGKCIAAMEWHWHYLCDCGELTAFDLYFPVPMYDADFYSAMSHAQRHGRGE